MVLFEIIENIDRARELWEKFCNTSLWEMPDLVFSALEPKDKIYFIVLLEDKEIIGLLPLFFSDTEKKYYYFGGSHPENRRFMFDLKYFNEVFEQIPSHTRIFDICFEDSEKILDMFPQYVSNLKNEDHNFYIDSKEHNGWDGFLKTFSSKHRKNLLSDIRKVDELNLDVVWERLENFSYAAKFNSERFGSESDYSDEEFVKSTFNFLKILDDKNLIYTLRVSNGDKVLGVEFAAFYDGVYYVLNGGYDRSVKNLGKFIMYTHMRNAEKLCAVKIDFLVGDTGWKDLWNMQKKKVYTLRKE